MFSGRIASTLSLLALSAAMATAQPPAKPAPPAHPPVAPAQPSPLLGEKETAATQTELIKLLKLSPTMTTVIARDPSLLADRDYVSRNNPQLAAFLEQHPEVVRNPDFYLFTHMRAGDNSPDEALQREVWPDHFRQQVPESAMHEIAKDLVPLLAFACFLVALIWLIRVIVENRRWNRIFKLQSEVHGRLIDKFGSTQELAAYMETEAGRRFLEAAPIPVNFEQERPVPNALARVLTPLQVGSVLILLGIGFLLLRHAGPDMGTPMLVLGVITLMPGLGFILSAGVTWAVASRLGLMPDQTQPHVLPRHTDEN